MRSYHAEELAAKFDAAELQERSSNIFTRMEGVRAVVTAEGRDVATELSHEERARLKSDSDSYRAHQEALELRQKAEAEQVDVNRQVAASGKFLDNAVAGVEARGRSGELAAGFAELEARAFRGEGGRLQFTIAGYETFLRSTTTANAGAAHEAPAPAAGGGGIWLPNECGATNLTLAPGTRIEAGVYGANTAVSPTSEGTSKPTFDPSSLGTSTVSPYAVSSNITIQSDRSGRGLEQFTWAATRKVRRSVNDAFTAALVTAAGSARAFATSAVASLDGAIAQSMADTAAVPDLIICDVSLFTSLASAGGGNNSQSAVPAYRGVRLVPSSLAALAGNALVVSGDSLALSMSGIEVRTQPQVLTNSTDAVLEVWMGVVVRGAGGVTLQDATTP